MTKNKITTSIGTINLNEMEFIDNQISVIIGIDTVSDNLKEEINRAIEIEKIISATRWKAAIKEVCASNQGHENELCKELSFRTAWSDNVVIDNIYLSVDMEAGKEIRYNIHVDFYDKENKLHDGSASIDVDLLDYEAELKKIIVKAMIDKFF